MAIEKILLLGNWDLCITIINALCPRDSSSKKCKYQVSVLTYPSQTLSLPSHLSDRVVQHERSDFSSSSLQSAFTGHDLIISTMFGGDLELQTRIVDATVAAGVKRFVPHEFGHDSLNEDIQARITKYSGRAKVIGHLKKASVAHPNFEWTAIATGYTLDTNLISGDLGFDMDWHSATLHGGGTETFAASSLERVGQVVASVIQHWDVVKNQYIYAAGVLTSANEILEFVGKATNQQWTVGNYNVEDCIREGDSRITRGFPDSGMFLLERSILYDERLDASAPFRTQSANELLQLQPESVEEIVHKAYHDFKHHGKPGCGCSS